MPHWLAPRGAAKMIGHVKRFDARYWNVNFPRPMMASVVTSGPHSLRIDATFYRKDDLAGLIWEAEDGYDHPLCAYETSRDFRRCRLRFRWRSGGLKPLDALHGPTLTIEGRNEAGEARGWFVRLWNHAQGLGEDALIDLDMANLKGGWDGEDPVWTGDVARMFISLVAPDYDESDAPLPEIAQGWAEITEMRCDGSGSVLAIGETLVPEHRLRIATGYDDHYHLTPERVVRNALALGYREVINHYVGMSHYLRLGEDGKVVEGLSPSCVAWHRDFLARAKAAGFEIILSLSYELLNEHCPEAWKQRAADGSPALTGWEPPSALLSPANGEAMGWLQEVARDFAALAVEAEQPVRFQVGEPWWWVRADGTICIYDDAAVDVFAPVPIGDVRGELTEAQKASLDAAGVELAASTEALLDAVRDVAPDAETLMLVYLPTVLEGAEVRRANVPLGWAGQVDVLQLEDYDWVTGGRVGATQRGIAAAGERLGYSVADQHYFSGFVLKGEDRHQWALIAAAAEAAFARGTREVFVWALPQVLRDGFTWFEIGEDDVEAFDDVRFPLAIGREAIVEPAFSTAVVTTASGAEQRNSDWSDARLRFDAGPGVRSEEQLRELIAFFRARRGAAVAFRFEDPFDSEAEQELIGEGDGDRAAFQLVRNYGGQERRITRPVAGSVRLFVGGVERVGGWALLDGGIVELETPPLAGAEVRASFRFDVPVRFESDKLQVSRATFGAGEAVSVPLIEVRE